MLLALMLAAPLAACAAQAETGPADASAKASEIAAPSATPTPTSEAWKFTDDRGKEISLPKRPKRILAQVHAAGALWDFGIEPVGIFGPHKRTDGTADAQAGNVDVDKVTSVGANFGEFNLEQYAALKPDLVVTIMYGPALWYIPEESQAEIEKVAPVVGIRLDGVSAAETIERFGRLAASLGADLQSDKIKDAREAFERSSENLRAAAKEKPGLEVEVAIGQDTGVWVADPDWHGDLRYLRDLGVDIVAPAKPDPAYGFEMLSWEQASRYQADLILEDNRTLGLTPDELAEKFPTWKLLKAVAADQVAPWHAETPSSYQLYTTLLDELTATIKKSRTDVVS